MKRTIALVQFSIAVLSCTRVCCSRVSIDRQIDELSTLCDSFRVTKLFSYSPVHSDFSQLDYYSDEEQENPRGGWQNSRCLPAPCDATISHFDEVTSTVYPSASNLSHLRLTKTHQAVSPQIHSVRQDSHRINGSSDQTVFSYNLYNNKAHLLYSDDMPKSATSGRLSNSSISLIEGIFGFHNFDGNSRSPELLTSIPTYTPTSDSDYHQPLSNSNNFSHDQTTTQIMNSVMDQSLTLDFELELYKLKNLLSQIVQYLSLEQPIENLNI